MLSDDKLVMVNGGYWASSDNNKNSADKHTDRCMDCFCYVDGTGGGGRVGNTDDDATNNNKNTLWQN